MENKKPTKQERDGVDKFIAEILEIDIDEFWGDVRQKAGEQENGHA
jgi:hypothetical protein